MPGSPPTRQSNSASLNSEPADASLLQTALEILTPVSLSQGVKFRQEHPCALIDDEGRDTLAAGLFRLSAGDL